jgi:hypothetical protein
MTTPTTSEELLTVDQAASLTGRNAKTVRRHLPVESNRTAGKALLDNARQQGSGANAPWLIPVSDLIALGWVASSPVAAATVSAQSALVRQRDDKELARLREEVAAFRASDRAKDQLLNERSRELDRLAKLNERLHQTLDLALSAAPSLRAA